MIHGVSKIHGKERKKILEGKGLINCSICPYHKKENASRSVPKPDKYKSIKRETIRKLEENYETSMDCED